MPPALEERIDGAGEVIMIVATKCVIGGDLEKVNEEMAGG